MKLVVGLGNPGREYQDTPHNAGFTVADRLADARHCAWHHSARFNASVAKARLGDEPLMLVKPETYMNSSGQAVAGILHYWKLATTDLVVVLDDADLPLGSMRIRPQGGSGGHRGLDSVIRCVGADTFVRVRIGIGRGRAGADLVEHVLSPLSAEERKAMDGQIARAAQAVETIVTLGVQAAMNRFNAAATRAVENGQQKDGAAGADGGLPT